MKKEYEKPTIEITEFEIEDIIARGMSVNEFGSDLFIGWDDF